LLAKSCGEEALRDFLEHLLECENAGATRVVLFDEKSMKGFSVRAYLSPAGLVPLEARRASVALADSPWEELQRLVEACDDVRLLRVGNFVISECLEEPALLELPLAEVCSFAEPSVVCFHEWGEE